MWVLFLSLYQAVAEIECPDRDWVPRASCLWCLVGCTGASTVALVLFVFEQVLSEALGWSGMLNLACEICLDSVYLQCPVVLFKVTI